jgi:hypothetical protein
MIPCFRKTAALSVPFLLFFSLTAKLPAQTVILANAAAVNSAAEQSAAPQTGLVGPEVADESSSQAGKPSEAPAALAVPMDTPAVPADKQRPGWELPQDPPKGMPLPLQQQLPLDTLANADQILSTSDILVFYGHPGSRNMGILGRYSMDELNTKLDVLANEYHEAGGRNIVTGFYIIYGTCWPGGEIGTISKKVLLPWIQYAEKHHMLVFLDNQIGKYDPVKSLAGMFPYLKYPNVHLALDPEWRTTKPMEEFGCVTGQEINACQDAMEKYIDDNKIEGQRMLVIHQFREVMIKNRAAIKSDRPHVKLIHCMDGVGTPKEKLATYQFNALATNLPTKSFKLFYDFKLPGVLVDTPLLSAKQVYALKPRPRLIMYQ